MPFSPEEIAHKEFVVAFRGYDRSEVRAFLRAVSADLRAVLEHERESSTGARDSIGQELDTVVRTASASARALQERAEREADLARARAETEAADVRDAAERVAQEIRAEAERRAAELEQLVERVASQRLEQVARETQELRTLEERMQKRLSFLESALELTIRDLEAEFASRSGADGKPDNLPVSAEQHLPSRGRERD